MMFLWYVFVIKVWLITLSRTLINLDITKTKCNNYFYDRLNEKKWSEETGTDNLFVNM